MAWLDMDLTGHHPDLRIAASRAWEAARRHELVMLGFADEIEEPKGLSFPSPRNSIDERRAARQRQIDSVRALVNPFSLAAPVSLERAA